MTRLYSLILFILVLLGCIGTPAVAESLPGHDSGLMTTHLGDNEWLTGDNDFEQIVAKATHEQKFILLVFCPNDHEMCFGARKNVFGEPEFTKVTEKAVPVLINGNNEQSRPWFDRIGLPVFPTCLLLSPDGQPLYQKPPYDTLTSYTSWLEKVEYVLFLERFVLKHPLNNKARKTLLDNLEKENDQIMSYKRFIDRVIEANPDPNDPITKEASEKRAYYLLYAMEKAEKSQKEKYCHDIEPEIFRIYDLYYPDRFEFDLKGHSGFSLLMEWYKHTHQPDMVEQVFVDADFVLIDEVDRIQLFYSYIYALGDVGDHHGVETILNGLMETFFKNRYLWNNRHYVGLHFLHYTIVINTLFKETCATRTEHHTCLLYQAWLQLLHERPEIDVPFPFRTFFLDILLDNNILLYEAMSSFENDFFSSTGGNTYHYIGDYARLFAAVYGFSEARKYLFDLLSRDLISEGKCRDNMDETRTRILIIEALSLIEGNDEKTLTMAEQALFGPKCDYGVWTFSYLLEAIGRIHAQLGNLYHAAAYYKEALRVIDREPQSQSWNTMVRESPLEEYNRSIKKIEQSGLPSISDLEIEWQ